MSMVRGATLAACLFFLLIGPGAGCSSPSTSGSKSGFLGLCETDDDCSDGVCWCGACTRACDTADECGSVHDGARCERLEASDLATSCDPVATAAVCTLPCSGDSECMELGEQLRCQRGACVDPAAVRREAAPPPDAGATGGAGGTGGGSLTDAGGGVSTGGSDASNVDGGPLTDASIPDGSSADASAEASSGDASDAAVTDGSTPDGSTPDGSAPDGSAPDSSTPEASADDSPSICAPDAGDAGPRYAIVGIAFNRDMARDACLGAGMELASWESTADLDAMIALCFSAPGDNPCYTAYTTEAGAVVSIHDGSPIPPVPSSYWDAGYPSLGEGRNVMIRDNAPAPMYDDLAPGNVLCWCP